MRDLSSAFRIAAARGALDAGVWAVAAALCAAGAGWWVASGWPPAATVRVLLAVVSTGSGIAALWYAIRIGIDRRLFAALAEQTAVPDADLDAILRGLDHAMLELGWIAPAKAGRLLGERVQGAVGLLRASVVVAGIQWLAVGVALVAKGF
ncbi:hypothetical protein [Burkholderia sp. Ax-1724]|uniref:hypothetical protein n=1 Tax=Burkholderia sp. Ax-1724 TaxID=2608336 RepID=UPI001421E281|nr:hypothetical protein [Burkholderia sp. Ax-1724]NIF50950.1 hypothetical protein [Burkholderia sp. Ax-1724]